MPMPRFPIDMLFALLVALALALGGCATVEPWERETLASERMKLDPGGADAALVDGRRRTREEGHVGAPGSASSGGGGGCGCN